MKPNPAKKVLDLALHPVRMRILMLLSGTQGLSPQQMAESMPDVPQATLYRHINKLADSGILVVVEERPVRGTLEKVYALNTHSEAMMGSPENAMKALKQLSKEDHMRFFTTFTLMLMDDFARYLNSSSEHPDFQADGVGYHKLPLYLSDEELAAFSAALNQAVIPFLGLENTPERKKRLFSTIMMPLDDFWDESEEDEA